VTAGLDTAIAVWAVPSDEALAKHRAHKDGSHPAPLTVYYPHFHSTEVHANYIDTAVFYGDLILSRSAKGQYEDLARTTTKVKIVPNEILLWKIDGFDSDDDPPTKPPIPTPGVWTRSSFPHDPRSRGFQRLMTFDMPNTSRFYLRFGLLHQPGVRPILAMGNEESKFLFWDLQKLEEGYDPNEESEVDLKAPGVKAPRQRKKGKAAEARQQVNESNLGRLGELRRGESVGGGANSDGGSGKTRECALPFLPIPAPTHVPGPHPETRPPYYQHLVPPFSTSSSSSHHYLPPTLTSTPPRSRPLPHNPHNLRLQCAPRAQIRPRRLLHAAQAAPFGPGVHDAVAQEALCYGADCVESGWREVDGWGGGFWDDVCFLSECGRWGWKLMRGGVDC